MSNLPFFMVWCNNMSVKISRSIMPELFVVNGYVKARQDVYFSPGISGVGKIKSINDTFDLSIVSGDTVNLFYEIVVTDSKDKSSTFKGDDYTKQFDCELTNGVNTIRYKVAGSVTSGLSTVNYDFTATYTIYAYKKAYYKPGTNHTIEKK